MLWPLTHTQPTGTRPRLPAQSQPLAGQSCLSQMNLPFKASLGLVNQLPDSLETDTGGHPRAGVGPGMWESRKSQGQASARTPTSPSCFLHGPTHLTLHKVPDRSQSLRPPGLPRIQVSPGRTFWRKTSPAHPSTPSCRLHHGHFCPGRSALTHSVVALEAGLCSWQPPVQASPVSRVSLPHLPQLREAYDSGPALSLVVWPSETQAPQDMCRTPWPHPARSGLQVTAAPANVQQEPCEALCQLSGRPPVFTKRAAQPQPQP